MGHLAQPIIVHEPDAAILPSLATASDVLNRWATSMAMNSPRQCADCGGELEMGFVPDVSVTVAQQSSWHRGEHDKTSRSSSGDFDYTWTVSKECQSLDACSRGRSSGGLYR